jgi:membrane protein
MAVVGPAFGGALESDPGDRTTLSLLWDLIRWPLLLLLVLVAFDLVYCPEPAGHQRFRFLSHSSGPATFMWLLFTLLFSVYVDNLGARNRPVTGT